MKNKLWFYTVKEWMWNGINDLFYRHLARCFPELLEVQKRDEIRDEKTTPIFKHPIFIALNDHELMTIYVTQPRGPQTIFCLYLDPSIANEKFYF